MPYRLKCRIKARSDLSAAKIAIKLQQLLPSCSVATYTLKRIQNEALPRYATQKCERALRINELDLAVDNRRCCRKNSSILFCIDLR